MIEESTNRALSYLLDELEPDARAHFERRLAGDAAAAAGLKSCADSLARFALSKTPRVELSEGERRDMLSAVLTQVEVSNPPLPPRRSLVLPGRGAARHASRRPWRRVIWPMAAAAAIALNLWQFYFGAVRSGRRKLGEAGAAASVLAAPGGAGARGGPGGIAVESATPEVQRQIHAEVERLAALRQEYSHLQRSRDVVNDEYRRIVATLMRQSFAQATAAGSVTAMELVDDATYGQSGRGGLLNLAAPILTQPGVVAADAAGGVATSPAAVYSIGGGTGVSGEASTRGGAIATPNSAVANGGASAPSTAEKENGTETAAVAAPSAAADRATTSASDTDAGEPPANPSAAASVAANTPVVSSSPEAADSSSEPGGTPYALGFFNAAQNQGYLNLFDLPALGPDQTLELWVQSAGSGDYQRVGDIPSQFYGQSGSIYYKLPDQTAPPSQILVTVEPAGNVPHSPRGPVVLHGP